MATSVHIPKPLLDAVDRKARALRISRNRLVVRALEREVHEGTAWSPGFFDRLAEQNDDITLAVGEMRDQIRAARRSKAPPRL